MNILYCGMADDIITPLILCPNFKKLFVIDLFDRAFSKGGTFEDQKEDIIQTLENGNDLKSHHREVCLKYFPNYPINHLKGSCSIKSNEDDGEVWRLHFDYLGVPRELIFFHHSDFTDEWDNEIQNIEHLFSVGAVFPFSNSTLIEMIKTRTSTDFKYYDNTYAKSAEKKTVRPLNDVFCHDGISNLGILLN